MGTRERLTARAAKRDEWADGRAAKAAAAWNAGDLREERSGIPLGQPVLVGHHSERRHRRAIDRAHAKCAEAVGHAAKATEHTSAAKSIRAALTRSIFCDDANAVEALAAKAAALEATAEKNALINKTWRRCLKNNRGDVDATAADVCATHKFSDATRDLMAAQARQFSNHAHNGPATSTHERAEARRCRRRIDEIRRRTVVTAEAEAAGGVTITGGALVAVSFAARPEREIIDALRSAGFQWSAPSWYGRRDALPSDVVALVAAGGDLGPAVRSHEIDPGKIAALAAVMRADEARNPPVELRGGGPGGVVEWTGTLADFLLARAGSTLWSSDTWQAIAALSRGPGSVYLCDGLCGPIVCLLRVG